MYELGSNFVIFILFMFEFTITLSFRLFIKKIFMLKNIIE